MSCGIYCIKNKVNDKRYVGLSRNIETRWKSHKNRLNSGNHINTHLQAAWNKYGESNFDFIIIELCSDDVIKDREIYYISLYKTQDNRFGYNQTAGGDGIKNLNEDCADKISLGETLYPVVKLDFDGNYICEYRNCRFAAEDTGLFTENIRYCCDKKGKRKTTGGYIWMYKSDYEQNGCDVEYYKILKRGTPVSQFTKDGQYIATYISMHEAERQTGCPFKNISAVCNGTKHTCMGYVWKFADESILLN